MLETNYIVRVRGTDVQPFYSGATTPEDFAAFLYEAPKRYLQDGDRVYLRGYARFAKEREWRLPSIELIGIPQPGGRPSELFTCCMIDAGGGKTAANTASIVLAKRNIFRNLTLVGRCWEPKEDAAITGHDTGGDQYVEFDGCILDAAENQDWGVYYQWSGNVNNGTTIVRNSVGYHSRFLIAECGSASPKASVLVQNTKLYGNADGSYTEGATNRIKESASCCPFLERSGLAHFENVECWARGPSKAFAHYAYGADRVVALITNIYGSKANAVTVTGKNVQVHELWKGYANGAVDIDLAYGSPQPVIDNSELERRAKGGSGEDGEFLIRAA